MLGFENGLCTINMKYTWAIFRLEPGSYMGSVVWLPSTVLKGDPCDRSSVASPGPWSVEAVLRCGPLLGTLS